MLTNDLVVTTSDPSATGLELGQASFNTSPPTVSGLNVTFCGGVFAGNHTILSPGQEVTLQFNLDQSTFTKTSSLRVYGLVSRNDPNVGYSPITLTVNGLPLVTDYVMPGQGWGPENATFQIPPAYLTPGTNVAAIQVTSNASERFWLYQLAVDLTPGPYTGETLEANLRTNPVTLSPGLSVSANSRGNFANGCWQYWANGTFSVVFTLTDTNARNDEVRVNFIGLVSRSGDQPGHAPIAVTINGQSVLASYTFPGNGWAPASVEIRPPAELCVSGPNTVSVSIASDATTNFWLYGLVIQKAEYYQHLGTAEFSSQTPHATNLTIDRIDGRPGDGHLTVDSGNVIEVMFDSPMPMLTMFEFDALVARARDNEGFAPITVALNGTSIINDYTIIGNGWNYTETCFMLPPALVRAGVNRVSIQASQGSRTLVWLKAMRVRTLLHGPAVRREMATSAPCYRAYNQISVVPLMFLITRPPSALGIVSSINKFAGSATITEAIGILVSAADDMIWMQTNITAAFARSNTVVLAGLTITAGTPQSTALINYLAYVIGRCQQESRRLTCALNDTPLNFVYTYGCDVLSEIQSRRALVAVVFERGDRFWFTDQNGDSVTYGDFADAATAQSKRESYLILLQANIVANALSRIEQDSQTMIAMALQSRLTVTERPELGNPILIGLFVAAVGVAVFGLYTGYKLTNESSSAKDAANFPMNWHGYITDWESSISYDWQDTRGIGYLKPGNIYSVCTDPGRRVEKPIDDEIGFFGSYFNYVYIAGDTYPIRLSPKNPALSPPGEIYHSQLAGGLNVSCAGELQFCAGKFRYVNTESGHYYKTEPDWNQCKLLFIQALVAMGYDVSEIGDQPYTGLSLNWLE